MIIKTSKDKLKTENYVIHTDIIAPKQFLSFFSNFFETRSENLEYLRALSTVKHSFSFESLKKCLL